MIGKWVSFSSLSFSSVRKKVKLVGLWIFFWAAFISLCVNERRTDVMLHKDRKIQGSLKEIWKRRYRPITTRLGPGAELSMSSQYGQLQPTVTPLPAQAIYGKKNTMQNYHDAKFQSPTVLKYKDGGNTTWMWCKEKGITSSFMWHHTLWTNWMSLWIHSHLQGGGSNNVAVKGL